MLITLCRLETVPGFKRFFEFSNASYIIDFNGFEQMRCEAARRLGSSNLESIVLLEIHFEVPRVVFENIVSSESK